jgi:hypothetical protein
LRIWKNARSKVRDDCSMAVVILRTDVRFRT